MEGLILPQKKFPLLSRYKQHFDIKKGTIFAYDGKIYTDVELPDCLIVHEKTHLKQQEEIGLDKWVDQYLEDPGFRLKMEIEAYRAQLKSIHNRGRRKVWKKKCAKDLSSSLYGDIISYDQAVKVIT